MSWESLAERKRIFLEDCCGGGGEGGGADAAGPTMSVGDDGYQSGAPATGPRAGFDPLQKFMKRHRKKRR